MTEPKLSLKQFISEKYKPGIQQNEAIAAIEQFLDSDKKVFLQKGYAGTGKTTLTKWLSDYGNYLGVPMLLMAPTGRAARIIQMKTGYHATTIHKGIYQLNELKERPINRNGKVVYKFYYALKNIEENIRTWYFIDESSMISDRYSEDDFFIFGSGKLLTDFINFTAPQNEARKIKLFFIGDDAQLPPVTDIISGALSETYLQQSFGISPSSFTLTEVFRQEGQSGILANATRLRKYITGAESGFFELDTSPNDIHIIEANDIPSQFQQSNPALDFTKSIVLVATNKLALDYNMSIRERIFPESNKIMPGETLMIQQNNYNYDIELFNGTLVKVLWTDENATTKSNMLTYDAEGNECRVSHRFRWVEIEVKDEKDKPFEVKCMILDNFLYSKQRSLSYEENIALYLDFKIRHPELKPGTQLFRKALQRDPWFNALRVKYGYAITVHKAQGGEWKEAIVDLDFYAAAHSMAFKRWLYTAITRASETLCFANLPDPGIFKKIEWKEMLPAASPESKKENTSLVLQLPENMDEILRALALPVNGFLTDHYFQLLAQMDGSGIKITQRKSINFCDLYTYEKQGKSATVMHYYNGKNKFTKNIASGSQPNDPALLIEVLERVNQPIQFTLISFEKPIEDAQAETEIQPIPSLEEKLSQSKDKWFSLQHKHLWKLYEALLLWSMEQGIEIVSVAHDNYKELYTLKKGEQQLDVYFHYNALHQFTAVMPKAYDNNSKPIADALAKFVGLLRK